MIVLGLDFETTFSDPVDPKLARVIETGAVLWDTNRHQPVDIYNQVSPWLATYGEFDPRVTDLTGLTEEDLNRWGKPHEVVFEQLRRMMNDADAVVAHNGTMFDKPVFESEMDRLGWEVPKLQWYDTSCDVPYPKKIETRKLQFLAPCHGFLNPFSHRAVFDVLSMLTVMSHYDIAEIHRRATATKVKVRAVTRKPWEDGGKSNAVAKEHGFRFDGATKFWTKTVLADEVESACNVPGLEIVVLA